MTTIFDYELYEKNLKFITENLYDTHTSIAKLFKELYKSEYCYKLTKNEYMWYKWNGKEWVQEQGIDFEIRNKLSNELLSLIEQAEHYRMITKHNGQPIHIIKTKSEYNELRKKLPSGHIVCLENIKIHTDLQYCKRNVQLYVGHDKLSYDNNTLHLQHICTMLQTHTDKMYILEEIKALFYTNEFPCPSNSTEVSKNLDSKTCSEQSNIPARPFSSAKVRPRQCLISEDKN